MIKETATDALSLTNVDGTLADVIEDIDAGAQRPLAFLVRIKVLEFTEPLDRGFLRELFGGVLRKALLENVFQLSNCVLPRVLDSSRFNQVHGSRSNTGLPRQFGHGQVAFQTSAIQPAREKRCVTLRLTNAVVRAVGFSELAE